MTEAHAAYRAWGNSVEALLGGSDRGSGTAAEATIVGGRQDREQGREQPRDQVILDELPQVYFIAARMLERLPPSVQLEDLVHAGVLGLLEAYESFDHERNAQFRTFARFRIRGAILDSLRSLDWGPRALRRRAREIAEAGKRLESTLGRAPEREELAQALGLSLAELDTAMTEIDGLQIVGQHTLVSVDSGEVHDLIESAPSEWENPFELYVKAEQKQRLTEAIAALNEREQMVLSLYYREELTMKEVAEVIGIAVSRVSQIHQAAIGKLRTALSQPEDGSRTVERDHAAPARRK